MKVDETIAAYFSKQSNRNDSRLFQCSVVLMKILHQIQTGYMFLYRVLLLIK